MIRFKKIFSTQKYVRPKTEGKIKSFSISYNLYYEEIYEALLMIIDKRSKKSRYFMGSILLIIALVCVILFARNPYGVMYEMIAVIFSVFSFLVFYYPTLKAKKGAKKISRVNGIYHIELFSDGYIIPYNKERIDICGDKDCRAFENNNVFAVRIDRNTTICLPKRKMTKQQVILTRDILRKYARKFSNW